MALLAVMLALAVAVVVQRVSGADAPLLLVLPIVLGAWRGGLGGGLMATALACAVLASGSSLPLLPGTVSPSPWPLLLLALAGAAVAGLGGALRHAHAHDEREFSEAMIESMPGVLYFYTEQGGFLRWNRNMEQATGYSHAEIAALHPLDLIPEQDRALVEARITAVFETGEAAVETGLRHKDGSSTP